MIRAGTGFDAHRFEQGRPLILGGVTIPHSAGLAGHSDADVLCHAIMDALLGAVADGDIGTHFPPGDERYRDVRSTELVEQVMQGIWARGLRVVNLDSVVVAERPRLLPHREAIRASMASLLGVGPGCISVKATTTEGLGPEGRGESRGCRNRFSRPGPRA